MTEITTKREEKKPGFLVSLFVVIAFLMVVCGVGATVFSDRSCLQEANRGGMSNGEAVLTCAGGKALSRTAN